jgi:RimJ/RimL family protein N-acetyltransferase
VKLARYGESDLWLTRVLETDPEVMKELGGPNSDEVIEAAHRKRLVVAASDWWFTIVPEEGTRPVGTIGVWPIEWEGAPAYETGWMLLPPFQGRGLATQALALLLERARADPAIDAIHAFPGKANAASNALCRRFGFALIGEYEAHYAGSILQTNHWRLDSLSREFDVCSE